MDEMISLILNCKTHHKRYFYRHHQNLESIHMWAIYLIYNVERIKRPVRQVCLRRMAQRLDVSLWKQVTPKFHYL